MVDPIRNMVEGWLTIYTALPLPFRAFLNLSLGFSAALAVVSIVWRSK